ncbi:MAG TPA: hypothetical protein VHS99_09145, partial [Chloroflexota bacterium]|nr:hypothetical protein [Chloroflexota bacterium]
MGLGRSQSGLAAAGHRPAPVTGDGVSMPRAVPPVEATGDAPAPHRASARQAQPTGSRILGPLAEPGALAAGLVFGLLLCLYALTGGGQGYSVDGTFSYEVARSLATDPQLQFLRQNRETLKRWGPVAPALAVVPTRLGASLGAWAPRRDTLQLDGRTLQLYDFPVLGPPGTAASDPGGSASGVDELRLPLPEALHVSRVQLVSFLSLATEVGDGAPVAELTLRRATGDTVLGRAVVRAGQDTAEWAYDVPAAARPQHRRARLAGHWPGNPQANLYGATLALEPAPAGGLVPRAETLVVRYLAPQGRLHLRSIAVEPAATATGDTIALPGPPTWSAAQHASQFTRFGFSFTNAWLMAATGALLVPLARVLGYTTGTGVTLALGFGVGTLAWPYAKLDFAEPAAGLFALASTVLVLYVTRRGARPRRARLWLVAAGGLAALGAGAKYTAVWFIPLLAAQLVLGAGASTAGAGGTGGAPWTRRGAWGARAITVGRELLPALAAFAAVPLVAMLGAVWLTGAAPALWTGWQQGLARGWLDFPLWEGLYGLLLSPGKGLFAYAPPLLLALAGLPFFLARHRAGALVIVAAPLVYLVVYGSKGVWHGGGWGPRYLVPALPFMAAWSLPLLARVLQAGRPSRTSWLRLGAAGLLLAGVGVQLLGVAKHPNRYMVMFRDHILPDLPDYGVELGGSHARAY